VFEIGSSLREARERQKLELSEIERETRIRSKYLQALEEDRFDRLPAPAYAKGFLRTYADYLGLDAQRFVDEYNAHFAPAEEPQAAAPVRIRRPVRLRRRLVIGVPVALFIGVIGWGFSRGDGNHHHTAFGPALPHTRASTTTPPPAQRATTPKPSSARIALVATRGPCWLSVRLGSETGTLLYGRTLEQGQTVRFSGPRLWIRVGAPWNLDATLNGKPVPLPATVGNVIAKSSGLENG
jgi:transcriptional regulator with XRE-family HTH domain